jgi:N-acetylmuramoyl-L-alanine amidase
MRTVVGVFLVWLSVACPQSGELRIRPAPFFVGGLEYVDLRHWAEASHFQFHCARKDRDWEVQLTIHGARFDGKTGSQRAEVNGITFYLAYPLIMHQGMVGIAQKDVDHSLRPIFFPVKIPPRQSIRTVAIAAGHGGKDSGNLVGGQPEKRFTLLLTKEVQQLVARAGLKPVLIRSSDRFVELDERTRLAKQGKADVYLELHYNSAGPSNAESRGVEVYCLTPAGASSTNGGNEQYGGGLAGNRHDDRNVLLAYEIQRALVRGAGLADRGVRRARFEVLRDADMPAVLIEAGFMSHPEEMRAIENPTLRRQTAEAILDGLMAYKRLVER